VPLEVKQSCENRSDLLRNQNVNPTARPTHILSTFPKNNSLTRQTSEFSPKSHAKMKTPRQQKIIKKKAQYQIRTDGLFSLLIKSSAMTSMLKALPTSGLIRRGICVREASCHLTNRVGLLKKKCIFGYIEGEVIFTERREKGRA
jgi:hypothetical protein